MRPSPARHTAFRRSNWTSRGSLARTLFEDDDSAEASAKRASPVEPDEDSGGAKARADPKSSADGPPVHSMPMLHADLATPTNYERPLAVVSRSTKR